MTALAAKSKRMTYGNDVIEWIEATCVLPTGDHIGEPFILMDWQKEWIRELYRVGAGGALQYRWALLGVPKGNGKSPLASALALYHLLEDPDVADPWVVVAAASDKQADIVFDGAKRMCEMSAALGDRTTRYRWEIQKKHGPGKLERVAASGGKLDGKIVSMLILDELHEWTLENWVVLTGGALKRRGSQIIQITTAGWDQDSICYREYAKGETLAQTANPTYFVKWFTAPGDMDYRDPKTWRMANPSMAGDNALVHEEVLADLAINVPESQFRRYRLNQWVDSEEFWLPPGAWEACRDDSVDLEPGAKTYVGWDASTTNDSTAVVLVQERGGDIVARAKVWEHRIRPDGNRDESWVLPIAEVENYIRDICREYAVEVVAFDPAFITWSAADLEAEGLPMVKMPQSPAHMVPATTALFEAIIQGRLKHNGDQVLSSHIKAVKVHHQRRGGDMLEKQRTGKKIDAAVALVMAVGKASIAMAEDSAEVFFT
jgi:phage terminase large subunit-like protein